MGRQELAPACSALRCLGELWGPQESEGTASDWRTLGRELAPSVVKTTHCLSIDFPEKTKPSVLEAQNSRPGMELCFKQGNIYNILASSLPIYCLKTSPVGTDGWCLPLVFLHPDSEVLLNHDNQPTP